MKKYDDIKWPTWENLPRKIKVDFISEWREFALEALRSYSRDSRKKFKLSFHGKN